MALPPGNAILNSNYGVFSLLLLTIRSWHVIAACFVDVIGHIDDDDAWLTSEVAAKEVGGVGMQGAGQAVGRYEFRHHDRDGFTRLTVSRNLVDVSQQGFEEEAIVGIQYHHAYAFSPHLPFFTDLFRLGWFDRNMHRGDVVR